MKLIVGLGNPGSQYEKTRHNAGFMAVDRAVAKLAASAGVRQRFGGEYVEGDIAGEKVAFLKPMRFMNCSGAGVGECVGFYKLSPASDVLVLVDDYALPLGAIRIRAEGSSGGHNGLSDIERVLGTQAYPRLRIGIDPPAQGYSNPADWVLGRFTDEQIKSLSPCLDRVVQAVHTFVTAGVSRAMNAFNTKVQQGTAPAERAATPAQPASPASPLGGRNDQKQPTI